MGGFVVVPGDTVGVRAVTQALVSLPRPLPVHSATLLHFGLGVVLRLAETGLQLVDGGPAPIPATERQIA